MRPFLRPLAAASLAAYLSVGWLTAGHAHVGHSHDGEAEPHACTACSCGHHHHHGPAKAGHRNDAPASPHDHDGCPVCEFLAQPPLAAKAVCLIAVRGPVLPVVEEAAPAFEPVAPPVSRSRGPPVA